MTEKELRIHLIEKYPNLHVHIERDCRQLSIFRFGVLFETDCALADTESFAHVESRLLNILTEIKRRVEYSITKIEGK